MEEKTSEQIAEIFDHAGHSVDLINLHANYAAFKTANPTNLETETEWKAMIERNVKHLETIKNYKKLDKTTSIWTTEDFTAIDKAITDGKKLYA